MYEIFKYGNIFAFLVGYQLRVYFLSIRIGWFNFPTKLTGGEGKFWVWLQFWASKFCFQIHSVSLKIGLKLCRGDWKNIFWFEFYEAILRCGYSCPDREKSVYKSEQALLLDSQNPNCQKCLPVRRSEQALLLDAQNLCWGIFSNPTLFLKRK